MITVKTQIGNGGKWYVEGRFKSGPLNLLKACRLAVETAAENRQVGGYRTVLVMPNGDVLDHPEFITTMADARDALA